MHAVRAEDKKVPLRPNSEKLIEAVLALPIEERTYIKIFKLGMVSCLLVVLFRRVIWLSVMLHLLLLAPDDPDVPKLKLRAIATGKKKRSSTESGSSSDLASETIATRMKRTKRAAAASSKGGLELEPIDEEGAKPTDAGVVAAVPETTVVDLDTVLEEGGEGGGALDVLGDTSE